MELESLAADRVVRAVREQVRLRQAETFGEQLRIVAIPAPTLREGQRAGYVLDRFEELGLESTRLDDAGNVLGRLPSPAGNAAPLVLSAHLDTVFPAGTELTPRRVGLRTYAPGIADNARGVAALLTLVAVLRECRIRTQRPLWFVGTVGEEGAGDLRGVKHLFGGRGEFRDAAGFISLDGTGLQRVVHRAIGSRRLRAVLQGPGGHSWSDYGAANAVHALGEAIARLGRLPHPAAGRATLTVARVGGGSSINAIPADAWLEVDIRGEEQSTVAELEQKARDVLRAAVEEENARRRPATAALSLSITQIGDRPGGEVADSVALVRAAVAATRVVGARPQLAASSTDANVPIALGIPAVTLGAGGESGGIHTLGEWYTDRDAARGVERALLTTLAAAGLDR